MSIVLLESIAVACVATINHTHASHFCRFTSAPGDLIKAVNSIPAYIENATHFFVVSPNVDHRELPKVVCGYSTWLERGWCRVEMQVGARMGRQQSRGAAIARLPALDGGGRLASFRRATSPPSAWSARHASSATDVSHLPLLSRPSA